MGQLARAESLAAFIEQARLRIDRALDAWLPAPPACPAIVSEAMRYSVFAGGKRLRPILTLAAADAVARQLESRSPAGSAAAVLRAIDLALPAACAIELIHTYSLIHDDLPAMDDDTLRRGRPTLHVVYGDGVAILAGDALQADAFGLLAREPETHEAGLAIRKLRVAALVAEAAGAAGMVGGQAIDLQAAGQVPGYALVLDSTSLEGMHRRKTGALIRASAAAGAVMAGGDEDAVDATDRWAADVGLAFQIVDDILDVEGSAGDLGKTAGKDAARDKPTYPALFGIDRSRTLARECLDRSRSTLARAALGAGWLHEIAEWVVSRRN
jgi:geranylgeranyl diphosphate synthase type II